MVNGNNQSELPQLVVDLVGESHENLLKGNVPSGALPYLVNKRGVKEKTIKLYGIGFCTAEHEKKINSSFYNGKSHIREYPFSQHISDCVIVPIKDDCGKLVSFATRGIGEGHRWWNSPFKKGNFLFGLNLARSACFHKNKAILVEGYIDQIICFQEGIQHTISPMGTRFTLVQIGLVLRYCENLCLCLDSDPLTDKGGPGPGQKATIRMLNDDNVKNNFRITTIKLPMGEDPDEFVLKKGAAKLLSLEK